MAHVWESNVVGGVDPPRFLLCDGGQFITNGEFEASTRGWTNAPGASADLARVADPITPFGDYALRLTAAGDGDPNEYSYTNCAYGSPLKKRTFVATFYARADELGATALVEAYCGTPREVHSFKITELEGNKYKQYAFIFSWYWGQSSQTFRLKFYPRNGSNESGYLYIDRLKVYEVTDNITALPLANSEEFRYTRQMQAKTVMIDGTIKTYVLGWRFGAFLAYDHLTAQQEILRARISEADLLIFWPHTDCPYCVTARYSLDKYLRQYFHNRFLGHVGNIVLEGVDVFDKKTERIVGVEIS